MIDTLSVKVLASLCNPYRGVCWEGLNTPLRKADITRALSKPLDPLHGPATTRQEHARRVAWFVLNGSKDPIEVDIGIPFLGCHVSWPVQDGNHRFAAAIYRGDDTIPASFGGSLNYGFEIGLLVNQSASSCSTSSTSISPV